MERGDGDACVARLVERVLGYRVFADAEGRMRISKAFNDAISEPHRTARTPEAVRPLHILLRDQDGRLLGGLIADSYWGWLDVDDFWLDETMRGQGLGRAMLLAAEKEAISRGCRYAKLETFSFQARGFYEKCGYRVIGQLDEYP